MIYFCAGSIKPDSTRKNLARKVSIGLEKNLDENNQFLKILHDAECQCWSLDSGIPIGRDKLSLSEFRYPEANIDIAHHVKPSKIDYFHPGFFYGHCETFLLRFFLAESRLIDLTKKYTKGIFFLC